MGYWEDRANIRLKKSLKTSRVTERYIRQMYKSNLDSLIKEYKELMKPYVLADGTIDTDALNFAIYYTDGFRSKRRQLERNIYNMMQETGEIVDKELFNCLSKVYKDNAMAISEELSLSVFPISDDAIRTTVTTPWKNGISFSNRIWDSVNNMSATVRNVISKGITNGESLDKVTARLMQATKKGYSESARLVRTETAHILNQSAIDTYKDAGVTEYEVLVEPGACEYCEELYENKRFSIITTPPPLHPNCRCCVVPVI